MIALWIYLAIGVATTLYLVLSDRGARQDAYDGLVFLVVSIITMTAWPIAWSMRHYWEWKRKRKNVQLNILAQSNEIYWILGSRWISEERRTELFDRWWNAENLKSEK